MATPTSPVANPDTASATDYSAITVNVLGNDVDPDSTETLTLKSATLANGLGTVSIVAGKVVYDPGTSYLRLDAGQTATVSIAYTIADKKGFTADSTLTVSVNGVNQVPIVAGARVQGTGDRQTISAATLLAGATDPENHILTVSGVTGAFHGTATLNTDGSVTFQRQAGFTGTASFSFAASDGHGGTTYATAQVSYQALAATGEPAGAIQSIATGAVVDAVLAPDGKNLIVGRAGGLAEYNIATGAQSASWQLAGATTAMSISADGKYVFAIGDNGGYPALTTLNLQTGSVTTTPDTEFHRPAFLDVVATSDGKAVIAVGRSGISLSSYIFDPATGTFGSGVASASNATSGVLVGSGDGTRFLLNSTYGSASTLTEYAGGGAVGSANSNSAGTGVAAVSNGGAFSAQLTNGLFLYDSQLRLLANLAFLNPDVAGLDKATFVGLAFSPDSKLLYALDIVGDQVVAFSTSDYTIKALYPIGLDATGIGSVYGDRLQISADGQYLTAMADNSIQVLDLVRIQSLPLPPQTLLGTAGDDRLEGTGGDDIIKALAGNDVVNGNGGNDQIDGGDGNDTLSGGDGDDVLTDTSTGSDTLIGGAGNDTLTISHVRYDPSQNPYVRDVENLVAQGGDGNDTVSVNSYQTGTVSVDLGAGDDTFTLGVSYATRLAITTGTGRDVIDPGAWFVLEPVIEVTDFTAGNAGDSFNVSRLVSGLAAGTNPFVSGDLRLLQRGADTILQVKSGTAFTDVARFDNTTVPQFTAANFNGFAPIAPDPVERATAKLTVPTIVTEGVGTSFVPILDLKNAADSVQVTVTFLPDQSSVTNGSDVLATNMTGTFKPVMGADGGYHVNLPGISYFNDLVVEGAETITMRVTAAGQLFANGTDTTTFTVRLADHAQSGTPGNDTLSSTRFDDVLSGGEGNDVFLAGAGSDFIYGGSGHNVAIYDDLSRHFGLGAANGTVTVTKASGTDTITEVQDIAFKDGHFVIDPDSAGAQVTRMYDTVLGRAPDGIGLDYWVDRVEDTGLNLVGVASALAGSAEFQTATGGLGNGVFVDYVYAHALGRAPDGSGRDFWTGQLDRGLSRGEMLMGFSESAEHRAKTAGLVGQGYFQTDDTYQAIALLYDSFANRLPDADGLNFWAGQVKSGAYTLGQVAGAFAASAEFAGATQGITNAQLVDFMFQNTLDRAPDGAGRAFWTDQLDHGLTKGQLLYEFSMSAEHTALMAANIIGGIAV